jgi:hypothetical protein
MIADKDLKDKPYKELKAMILETTFQEVHIKRDTRTAVR